VVSDSTKLKAAGSLSAFCPRLDAVAANEAEGSASAAIVAPALIVSATTAARKRNISLIELLLREKAQTAI
jgi:hypothetical protein